MEHASCLSSAHTFLLLPPRRAVCPEAHGPPYRRVCSPEHQQQRQQQQQFSLLTQSYLIPGHPQCRALHQLVPLRGRTQLLLPTLLSRVKGVAAQNLPHLTDLMSNTIWPDIESLDVSTSPGSIQVLLYSGDRERLEGRTGQRCPIRDCPGEMGGVCGQPASWGFPGHSLPGHSVLTICKPTQGLKSSHPFPFNLFSLPCPVPQSSTLMWVCSEPRACFRSPSLLSTEIGLFLSPMFVLRVWVPQI